MIHTLQRNFVWIVIIGAMAWWSWPALRAWTAPKLANASPECPLPDRALDDQWPLQTEMKHDHGPWLIEDVEIRPLAGFSLAGRVLSRETYSYGRESKISPLDLAIGWGPMTKAETIEQLDITQGGRWYGWRTKENATIQNKDIIEHSSNMHMIPANDKIARTLSKVRAGNRVRLDGWLVEASEPSSPWKWRSSLRRNDTGDGACEVFYVCRVEIEGSYP